MDKDYRVTIDTINAQFDVSVGTIHTIIHEELKMRKICVKFVPRVLREDQKERRCHDSREMVELINSDPTVLDALVTCNESWIYCCNILTSNPAELSNKKCTCVNNRCIWLKLSGDNLNCRRVELGADAMLTEAGGHQTII